MNKKKFASRWVFMTGCMITLLGALHGFVLIEQHKALTKIQKLEFIADNQIQDIALDGLLYSAGIGATLLFAGLLVCYSHSGLIRAERWAWMVSFGVGALLGSFGSVGMLIAGYNQPILYVHFAFSLSLLLPLLIFKKELIPMAVRGEHTAVR